VYTVQNHLPVFGSITLVVQTSCLWPAPPLWMTRGSTGAGACAGATGRFMNAQPNVTAASAATVPHTLTRVPVKTDDDGEDVAP
jgi:hypothetical protein